MCNFVGKQRLFLMLLPSINYLVFPAVQALTSEELRARLAPAKNRPKARAL